MAQRREKKGAPSKDRRPIKKKTSILTTENIDWVDYKDVNLLRRFISDRGKIRARRVSGNCAQHQREVAVAIKTARELGLLPYATRTLTERSGPRGPRSMESAPMPIPGDDDAPVPVGLDVDSELTSVLETDLDLPGVEVTVGASDKGPSDEVADEATS